MVIWRGTTPTIQVVFKTVDPASITNAILTFYTNQGTVVEKNLTAAVVGATSISWTLSQQETLDIQSSGRMPLYVICNWLTSGGMRGVSVNDTVKFEKNPVNEVMA